MVAVIVLFLVIDESILFRSAAGGGGIGIGGIGIVIPMTSCRRIRRREGIFTVEVVGNRTIVLYKAVSAHGCFQDIAVEGESSRHRM